MFVYEDTASKAVQWAANCNVKSLSVNLLCWRALCGVHLPQVKGFYAPARRSADMDADPPRFEARRATSWLVLFMTHIASCGAGAVIKSSSQPGHEFMDATGADFRQKLAMRPHAVCAVCSMYMADSNCKQRRIRRQESSKFSEFT